MSVILPAQLRAIAARITAATNRLVALEADPPADKDSTVRNDLDALATSVARAEEQIALAAAVTIPTVGAGGGGGGGGGSFPAWRTGLTLNEWHKLTGLDIISAMSGYSSPGGQKMGLLAYGGLAVHPTTGDVYAAGGGHTDYAGNEVAKLTLSADSPAWSVVGPIISSTPQPTPTARMNQRTYADGRPTSRHTYKSMIVSTALNRIFFCGLRAPWESASPTPYPATDAYRLDTDDYVASMTYADVPSNGDGSAFEILSPIFMNIDTSTSEAWMYARRLMRLSLADGTWTDYGVKVSSTPEVNIYGANALDKSRKQILVLNAPAEGSHRMIDYTTPASASQNSITLTGSGASALNSALDSARTNFRVYVTMVFADAIDKYVVQDRLGTTWTITPGTWAVEPITITGTAPNPDDALWKSDLFGRWSYVPTLRGCVLLMQKSYVATETWFLPLAN